jgi:hypothetical protein
MKFEHVVQLLAMASVIDPRVSRKSDAEKLAMAEAWFEIFDDKMPFEFAVKQLKKHYERESDVVMPATFMVPWKSEKNYQQDKAHVKQLEANRGSGMPDDVRQKLKSLGIIGE